MNNWYADWCRLFDEHMVLLHELNKAVQDEKAALLENEISHVRETSLLKDKATRKILQIQGLINDLKERHLHALKIDQNSSLQDLFLALKGNEQTDLLKRRAELMRLSKDIERVNRFNAKCLNSFLEYIGGVRNIFRSIKNEGQVYSPTGQAQMPEQSGRLVRRSF